jgi:hypothetical protein
MMQDNTPINFYIKHYSTIKIDPFRDLKKNAYFQVMNFIPVKVSTLYTTLEQISAIKLCYLSCIGSDSFCVIFPVS